MNQAGNTNVQTRQKQNAVNSKSRLANRATLLASFEINYTNRTAPSLLHDLVHMIGYQVSSLLKAN